MALGEYPLGSVVLVLGAGPGLAALYAGGFWIRLLGYRITRSHLELTLAGRTRLRRVPLRMITDAAICAERLSLRAWVRFHLTQWRRAWKASAWRTERWANRSRGPFVILRRSAGPDITLSPGIRSPSSSSSTERARC